MAEERNTFPEKMTLSKFVEDNYKLFTGMAAFIALTAFASQSTDNEAKTVLAGGALLAACLFALELFFRLPFNNQHWRLALFELVMAGLTLEIGRYFFLHFAVIWGPAVSMILVLVFLMGPPVLLGTLADWILKRTRMSERARQRVGFSIFIGSFVLLYVLAQFRLGGHSISIHVPKFLTDPFFHQ